MHAVWGRKRRGVLLTEEETLTEAGQVSGLYINAEVS